MLENIEVVNGQCKKKMKYGVMYRFLIVLFFFNFITKEIFSQSFSGNRLTFNHGMIYGSSIEAYSQSSGINLGGYETMAVTLSNRTSSKVEVTIQIAVSNNCGGTYSFTKSTVLNPGQTKTANPSPWSVADTQVDIGRKGCESDRRYSDNFKSIIAGVNVSVVNYRDLTAEENKRKQEEEKRRQEQEAARSARTQSGSTYGGSSSGYGNSASYSSGNSYSNSNSSSSSSSTYRQSTSSSSGSVSSQGFSRNQNPSSSSSSGPQSNSPQQLTAAQLQEKQRQEMIRKQQEYEAYRAEQERSSQEMFAATVTLLNAFQQNREHNQRMARIRAEQQAREREEARKVEEAKRKEREIVNRRRNLRILALRDFSKVNIPKESLPVSRTSFYAFAVYTNDTDFEKVYASAELVKPFKIQRDADGSWPSPTDIELQLAETFRKKYVLITDFYSFSDAQDKYNQFKSRLRSEAGFTVSEKDFVWPQPSTVTDVMTLADWFKYVY